MLKPLELIKTNQNTNKLNSINLVFQHFTIKFGKVISVFLIAIHKTIFKIKNINNMKTKTTLLFLSILLFSNTYGQTNWQKIKRGAAIFRRGFSGAVYRTDAVLNVEGVSDSSKYKIDAGLVYRKMIEEDGYMYLKVLNQVTKNADKNVKLFYKSDTTNEVHNKDNETLYRVKLTDLKSYNKIWQQGMTWSTLVLPIKYRPATEFNGTKFERTFSTDLSIGPFLGYKFKTGKSYNQFFQFGAFAGPTLIQFPTTVVPNNNQSNQNNITNDNLIGFTYGWGIVFQFDQLQIGLINGLDQLGGEKSKQWQYDKKTWWSFAVGYKFLN